MFRLGGLSIAVGNARDELKAEAAHVTHTVDDDGFARSLRDLGLINAGRDDGSY
jgi:hydroxymethylpyrimidine pyrophosphatase-like HAD family hydrolase